MTLLLHELKEKLKQVDELTLLEKLDLTSEELVDILEDQIEEKYDVLAEEYDESENQED